MNSPAFTFDAATHAYTLDGRKLPGVTSIIAPIRPGFSMVPLDVLEAKRELGTAVHLATELDDMGELDDAATDSAVMLRVNAWRAFKLALQVEVLMNEQRLFHPVLMFAGTLDRFVLMRARGGMVWLVDLKTGEPDPSIGVQLAGYQALVEANAALLPPFVADALRDLRRASVHLRADGTYKLVPWADPADMATFMACLAIYQWKARNPQ